MWHYLTAVAFATAVFSIGAYAQPGPPGQGQAAINPLAGTNAQPRSSRQAPQQGAIESQTQVTVSCSCDCCQVTKLLPLDVQPLPNGQTITSTCGKAVGNNPIDGSVADADSEICPEVCQIPTSNAIIFSNQGEVDYNRYCGYNCQPVTDAQGTSCVQLEMKDYTAAQSPDGNGNGLALTPVLGIGSGYVTLPPTDWGGDSSGDTSGTRRIFGDGGTDTGTGTGTGGTTAQSATKPEDAVEIVYDMRKLIAERLRSEAGAAVAEAASSAERVRINKFKANQDLTKLKTLKTEVTKIAGKVEQSTSGVEKEKNDATESENKAKKAIVEGSTLAAEILKTTRKLADEEIRKQATPSAEQAAKVRAEAKGLNKPDGWNKVVAARAANPYQEAVSAAVQRSAEYKRLADGLMDKAYAAQKEANGLISHVNALEAQGDTLGAIIEKKQITNLLSRARSIAAEATNAQTIAERTREAIPKWQNAAQQAAAYADWEYKQNAAAFR